jgi:Trk-type K+ transport system membrane component
VFIFISVVALIMGGFLLLSIHQNLYQRAKPDWAETVLILFGAIFFSWFLNFWAANMDEIRDQRLDSEQRLEQVQQACDKANGTVLFTQNGTECWKNPVAVP